MPYQENFLLRAYRSMRTIREFEERCIAEFMGGNVPGFVHASNGQEAIAVAACIDLSDSDIIGSTHRGHGHCSAKGCDIGGMMKEIMGRSTGLCKGKGGSMHIADIDKGMLGANAIVGGGPPLVNGAALASKTLGTKNVALSFNGDGSANQGTTMEAMNMAVVLQLPHVFIYENNGYAEGTAANYGLGCDSLAMTSLPPTRQLRLQLNGHAMAVALLLSKPNVCALMATLLVTHSCTVAKTKSKMPARIRIA